MRLTSRRMTMSGILGGWLLMGSFPGAVCGQLKVGDIAPEFCCEDDQGTSWQSCDHVGKKIIVMYFYPSDFTFCCTRQANSYRDRLGEFAKLNAEVVGISGDDVRVHREFKGENKLTHSLLVDTSGGISDLYDVPFRNGGKAMLKGQSVPRTVTTARQTIVIGLDGRIIYRATEVSPIKDAQEVLEFLRK